MKPSFSVLNKTQAVTNMAMAKIAVTMVQQMSVENRSEKGTGNSFTEVTYILL
jgi:hypothetical protein